MFPRHFDVTADNKLTGNSRVYRDVDLYNDPADENIDVDHVEICCICHRDPRTWVMLAPCTHKLCIPCAYMYEKATRYECPGCHADMPLDNKIPDKCPICRMDVRVQDLMPCRCPICRLDATLIIPTIPRLGAGASYRSEEATRMYNWYSTKKSIDDITDDAMLLFHYVDRPTIERRLIARKCLIDSGRADVVSKNAAVKRKHEQDDKKCLLCPTITIAYRLSCCRLALCSQCIPVYQRVERLVSTGLDCCPVCASSTPKKI
jgi:hypothetical protein